MALVCQYAVKLKGWQCLWWGHSVNESRPLSPWGTEVQEISLGLVTGTHKYVQLILTDSRSQTKALTHRWCEDTKRLCARPSLASSQ